MRRALAGGIALGLGAAGLLAAGGCILGRVKEPSHVRLPLPGAEEIAKLPPDGGPEFNRLVFERSPYLLQHARNPVDWHAWGPAAFEKAKREDKPVLLSIGYSTCHWCHVMERESFEDEDVARILNERYVSIKVDREERPDVDQIYMSVCIGLTGSGGWPLTILMTPEQKPFFAGTYFPKEGRFGRPGFMDVLARIAEAWRSRRKDLDAAAEEITRSMREGGAGAPALAANGALGLDTLAAALSALSQRFDPDHGGFGHAPKFPSPHQLSWLLRQWRRSGDPTALGMAERTLEAMARGGIHDHLGGGFHRYSTDREWLVPHFEKMLYDQALLALAYVDAFQATGKPLYAETARGILGYVLRDLADPAGGFHSAEDADSEGLEGRFYVWTPGEVDAVLGEEEGGIFRRVYGVVEGGNFDEPHGPKGCSVLHLASPVDAFAKEAGMDPAALAKRLAASRARLLAARAGRVRPHKDDKVLADWNGLMIAALARAAAALDEPAYAEAASRAADFALTRLRDPRGRLLHRYRAGSAGIPAMLDDHAFLAWGLIELYQATFRARWLEEALRLSDETLRLFRDERDGSLFLCGSDAEALILRPKEVYDGAIPSGCSVAAWSFLRLARMTGRADLEKGADAVLKAFHAQVEGSPAAHAQLLIALDFALGPACEAVIAGAPDDPAAASLVGAARRGFFPRTVLLFRPAGAEGAAIVRLAPFVEGLGPREGKAAAYVCEGQACRAPVADAAALRDLLR